MAGHALDLLGGVDELAHPPIPLIGLAQLPALLQGLVQGHVQGEGHHAGHLVHVLVAHVHHPAHVPHHRLGRHGAEGDDLGHVVGAVAPGHVVDHLAPALVVEVDIQVGHGHPLRVQKAFKDQVIAQGIDLGDEQAVGHDGPRAAAPPRPHQDAVVPGVFDEIPHDEEVIHKAHGLDDPQLVLQPLPGVLPLPAVALFQPLQAQLAQQVLGPLPRLQGKAGQVAGVKVELHLAAPGDPGGVVQGLGEVGEQRLHLLPALDVQLLGGHAHPAGVGERLAGLDAHEHLLGLGVLPVDVVAVVGDHQGDVQPPGQPHQAGGRLLFLGDAVVLQLDEEIALAVDVLIGQGHLFRLFLLPRQHQLGQVPGQAGRQGDEPPGVLA